MKINICRPIVFHPIYKQLIWGGNKIAQFKNAEIPMANVGESWELSAVPGNECENTTHQYAQGTTVLIPACVHNFYIKGKGKALLVAC